MTISANGSGKVAGVYVHKCLEIVKSWTKVTAVNSKIIKRETKFAKRNEY